MKKHFIFCLLLTAILFSCEKKSDNNTYNANRFERKIILDNLADPTKMDLDADGNVYISLKGGQIFKFNTVTGRKTLTGTIPTKNYGESGLLSIALDPDFQNFPFVYAFFTSTDGDYQRISRFSIKNDKLDLNSEINFIHFKVFQERHQGGGIEFGKNRDLYIGIGENSHPGEASGYAPIDERPGMELHDSQRSSANSKSFNGKILRIKVNTNGTYSIPEGNLFASDDTLAKPEVYIMGCRNPFKLFPDSTTGILYWGEVGPDAGVPGEKGPQGYDEINAASEAGFYGWPYFIANNIPYNHYDYATYKAGETFNPASVMNLSPNNTGHKKLPFPKEAYFYYTYDENKNYPQLGSGGRCVMAGPVYHYHKMKQSESMFPKYFDDKLFFFDWMRCKIWTINTKGTKKEVELLFPEIDFKKPVDIKFNKKGVMYVLEWGSNWNNNTDGRLSIISYNRSNRKPVPVIAASKTAGKTPLSVTFDASKTTDLDNDKLKYTWFVNNAKVSTEEEKLIWHFENSGKYEVKVVVKDDKGASAEASVNISAGNEVPQISINLPSKESYIADGNTIYYAIKATDLEDGDISSKVKVTYRFIPVSGTENALDIKTLIHPGLKLIKESDCGSCHKQDISSIGPSYAQIQAKYSPTFENLTYLAKKIQSGGNGVWGQNMMSAHPTLDIRKLKDMVRYILSDSSDAKALKGQNKGSIIVPEGAESIKNNALVIQAWYKDNAVANTESNEVIVVKTIRTPYFFATENDGSVAVMNSDEHINLLFHTSYIKFNDVDLTNVKSIDLDYTFYEFVEENYVEILIDNMEGKSLGKKIIPKLVNGTNFGKIHFEFPPVNGSHTLYIRYRPNLKVHEHFIVRGFKLNF